MGSPFDSGKALMFKSKSTAGSKRYLNGDPSQPSATTVFLKDFLESDDACYWECNKQTDGTYRLKIQSTEDKCYLDSSAVNPTDQSVYLSNVNAGGGSYWTPTQLSDGAYSMKSHTTSGPKCFMSADPSAALEASVYLVDECSSAATQWQVGMALFTSTEVENIICKKYPDLSIKFYQADPTYGSLEYCLLLDIWKEAGLSPYQFSKDKFDSDDYAICLKAEVAKYSYNKSSLSKGLLCGIMWGKNNQGAQHAFNFTIDPFGQLILFEPQNGQQISHNEYTPYFCMV